MRIRKIGSILKIILFIVLVSFVIALIFFTLKFTNGGTTDFKTFYVQVGDELYTDDGDIVLSYNHPVLFETKYTFSNNKTGIHKGYKVKVISNDKSNYGYYVDGKKTAWKNEKDLTNLFAVDKTEKSFTLTVVAGTTFETVLREYHADKELDLSGAAEYEKENPYLYDLVISSYNESVVYHIRFALDKGDSNESNT